LIDAHYTPDWLAELMASSVKLPDSALVVDFAAGDGALLEAVAKRSGDAICHALDIDAGTVERLRSNHPDWIVSRGDFLNRRSFSSSHVARACAEGFDAIFLNPPFSGRGGRRSHSRFKELDVHSGKALAFVITALGKMQPRGSLVAVLPAGFESSFRDLDAWNLLQRNCNVTRIDEVPRTTFAGVSARASVVKLTFRAKASSHASRSPRIMTSQSGRLVTLDRGRLPVYKAELCRGDVPFFHSTNLLRGVVSPTDTYVNETYLSFGPALLIPRVGVPNHTKLAIVRGRFAMSDCLFSVFGPAKDLQALRSAILKNWDLFKSAYSGPCAPYLTVDRLVTAITAVDFAVAVSPRLERFVVGNHSKPS
jgi:tRNA1(Val) A37 N6-methylase TrmN6